ncbi:LOW QUALITY PROTEIN: hypothetical protein V1478_014633 [Vespula squamosa]|uniref:Uncharacterized protein n=1 Tax=Vespula squamosa TaxID=30214 RepID=A0ABD2A5F1_VESSQ
MRETRFPSFELQGESSDHPQVKISTGTIRIRFSIRFFPSSRVLYWQRVDRISLGRTTLVIFRFKCKITELHQANIRREVIIVFRGEEVMKSKDARHCFADGILSQTLRGAISASSTINHRASRGKEDQCGLQLLIGPNHSRVISTSRLATIEEQSRRPHSKRQDIKRGDKLVTINRGRQIEVARRSLRTWLKFHLEVFFAILTPLSASICVPPIVYRTRSFAGTIIMSREFEAVCGKYMDAVPMGLDQQGTAKIRDPTISTSVTRKIGDNGVANERPDVETRAIASLASSITDTRIYFFSAFVSEIKGNNTELCQRSHRVLRRFRRDLSSSSCLRHARSGIELYESSHFWPRADARGGSLTYGLSSNNGTTITRKSPRRQNENVKRNGIVFASGFTSDSGYSAFAIYPNACTRAHERTLS